VPPPDLEPNAVRQALDYYDDWLALRRRYLRIPGVQAAVWYDGGVALSTAHGHADVEHDVPLTAGHLFRIASHTKTFTATVVMQLVEEGALRLDDTCDHVLGDVSSALAAVTVRELLQHTSGLVRDGFDGDFWQLYHDFPDTAALAPLMADGRALAVPRNDRFKYSNIGYGVLGLIVEAVTGRSYADAVRQRITERLGLADTAPEYDPSRAADYATGYSALAYADARVPIEQADTRALASATGAYSTTADLVRYFAAHCEGAPELLTEDSKRQMQNGAWSTGQGDERYGLGLSVVEVGDRTVRGHGGGYPGHSTSSVFDTDAGLAVSVCTNAIDGAAEPLAHAAVRLIDHACDGAVPSGDGLQRYAGRFATLWTVVDVALLGGRLFLVRPTLPDPVERLAELEVEDDTTLRIAGGSGFGSYGEQLHYRFAADETIESVRGESAATMVPLDRFSLPERVAPGWQG